MQRSALQFADPEGFAIGEQVIELRSVPLEIGASVEQFAEHFLHADDILAYSKLAAQLLLQIRRSRDVIGMGVRFYQPRYGQFVRLDIFDDKIGRAVGGAARTGCIIQNRIDNCRFIRRRIVHDIGDRVGRRVEEARNCRSLARFATRTIDLRAGADECLV